MVANSGSRLRFRDAICVPTSKAKASDNQIGQKTFIDRSILMELNIVAACDDDYAQHTCVMLTSLLFHHATQRVKIYLLVPASFSRGNRRKIIDSLNRWQPELEFVSVCEF